MRLTHENLPEERYLRTFFHSLSEKRREIRTNAFDDCDIARARTPVCFQKSELFPPGTRQHAATSAPPRVYPKIFFSDSYFILGAIGKERILRRLISYLMFSPCSKPIN